jgi:hypothetical protein
MLRLRRPNFTALKKPHFHAAASMAFSQRR